MNAKLKYAAALFIAAGFGAVTTLAIAEPAKKNETPKAESKLPPGWTEQDLQSFIEASTPGKMQEYLAGDAGEWTGKSTTWMGPGGEGLESECTSTVTPLMDGRYTKIEVKGEIPGMGPYHGVGIYGYDNVAKKFVSTWIDNHSTGMMVGDGELSKDQKTLTWNYTFSCPILKKPVKMREIDTTTGPNSKTLTMFGPDPKSGKEYKMMSIELTRK